MSVLERVDCIIIIFFISTELANGYSFRKQNRWAEKGNKKEKYWVCDDRWIIALKTHFFNISLHLKLIYRAVSLSWPACCQFIGKKDIFHKRKRKGWTPIRGSGGVGGGTPDFKCRGWWNGGKNQNPKKSMDRKLTPKTSHAEFPSLNKFGCTLFAELYVRDYAKLVSRALSFQIVLNTPKNPNLNRATQKK